jgi:hypothetical protein
MEEDTIVQRCPHCRRKVEIQAAYRGREVTCSVCEKDFVAGHTEIDVVEVIDAVVGRQAGTEPLPTIPETPPPIPGTPKPRRRLTVYNFIALAVAFLFIGLLSMWALGERDKRRLAKWRAENVIAKKERIALRERQAKERERQRVANSLVRAAQEKDLEDKINKSARYIKVRVFQHLDNGVLASDEGRTVFVQGLNMGVDDYDWIGVVLPAGITEYTLSVTKTKKRINAYINVDSELLIG